MLQKLEKEIKAHKIDYFFLLLLLLFGAIIRLTDLDGIAFGYDQARDAYRIRKIIEEKDFKLLGPETDISGVHHGPLYYYLVALPYTLFGGDPRAPTVLLIFINLLGILLIYLTSLKIFKNRLVALFSAFFYTLSYGVFGASRWLSNPSPSLVSLLLFFLGLWLWVENDRKWWLFTAIGLGLSIQFEFLFLYFISFVMLIFFVFSPRVKINELFKLFLILLLILGSFIVAEFRFNFMATKALTSFITVQRNSFLPVIEYLDHYLNSLARTLVNNVFVWNTIFALFLFLFIIFYLYKHIEEGERKALDFVTLWFFSTAPLYVFSVGAVFASFINMPVILASFILFARFIGGLVNEKKILLGSMLLFLSIGGNIALTLPTFGKKPTFTSSVASRSLYLKNEKRIVDYIYQEAGGQPFSFCAVTAPLFNNVVWSYVFETYGKPKYGYLPFWSGSEQEEFDFLPPDEEHVELRFLLMESSFPLVTHAVRITRLHEDLISEVLEKREFDGIEIEKRLLLNEEEREETRRKFLMEMTGEQAGDWQEFIKDPRYSCFH